MITKTVTIARDIFFPVKSIWSWSDPRALTHWGRATHICVSEITIIGTDNGLSPGRHQAIIWINAGLLQIGHLGKASMIFFIKTHTFSLKKIHLIMSPGKLRPFLVSASMCEWWRHNMEAFTAILVVCEGNLPVTGEFRSQRASNVDFDGFFNPYKLLKNSRITGDSWSHDVRVTSLKYDAVRELPHVYE